MSEAMPVGWVVAALRVEAENIEGIVRRPALEARVTAWRNHARNLEKLAEHCRRHADDTAAQMEDVARGADR